MATLTLTDLYVHDAADLSDYTTVGQNAEMVDTSQPVEVRRMAGGRFRSVSRPGAQRVVQLTCRGVTRAEYVDLRSRVGVPVLVRDQRGLRLWGVIGSVSASEFIARDLLEQVSFQVAEITWSEVV